MDRGSKRLIMAQKGEFKNICSITTDSRSHLEQLDSHYGKHKLKKASHQNYVIYGFYSNNDPSYYVLNINKLLEIYINKKLKKDCKNRMD